MLVPLLLGSLCTTFFPDAGEYFGTLTNGLISGTVPILAVWFFCMGATINLRATGTVLRKSGTLVVTKILVAMAAAYTAAKYLPPEGVQAGWRAPQIPDTGPYSVRPGMEDGECPNGGGSSHLSSRTRP